MGNIYHTNIRTQVQIASAQKMLGLIIYKAIALVL